MAQDDLATIFRRAMEAYSRGDYEAAVVDFDAAIEWSVDPSVVPDATTYHGHDGVRRFWDTWAEAISGMKLEIEECRRVGEDRVLAITRARGTGAGSGAPVASPRFAQVADFRDGWVVRVRLYGGVAAALEAGVAMSHENVEVVRALWAGLERGDVRFDLCDEQIVLRTAAEIRSRMSTTATPACASG